MRGCSLLTTACVIAVAAAGPALAQDSDPADADPGASEAAAPAPSALTKALKDDLDTYVSKLNQDAADKSVFTFDYGVPASPALSLLGLTDDKVTQSNSLKPFVLALPGVVSGQDSSKAIAVEVSPAWLLETKNGRSFRSYAGLDAREGVTDTSSHGDTLGKILFRTHLSAGVYAGVADPDPTKQVRSRVALGLSTTLLSSSDPVQARLPGHEKTAFSECVGSGWDTIVAELEKPDPVSGLAKLDRQVVVLGGQILDLQDQREQAATNADRAAIDAKIAQLKSQRAAQMKVQIAAHLQNQKLREATYGASTAAKIGPACRIVADIAARTAPDLSLGAGALWQGTPGKVAGLTDQATVVWASFRYPILRPEPPPGADWRGLEDWASKLDNWFMIGFSGRAGFHEFVPTGNAVTPMVKVNRYTGWVGLEWNRPDARVTAQIGREKIDANDASGAAYAGARTRYLISGDYKLADTGLWVNLSYGQANGVGQLKSDKVTKLTFSYSAPPPADVLTEKQAAAAGP